MKMKKQDLTRVKTVIKLLDAAARKHGLQHVRYAVNKWATGQRDKIRLTKQKLALERELTKVMKRLG